MRLRSLEYALSRVLSAVSEGQTPQQLEIGANDQTPAQRVMDGDPLDHVIKHTGRSEDIKLAGLNQRGRNAVRQKHALLNKMASVMENFGDNSIRIYASPVKTNTLTYLIFTDFGAGYANIYPEGAMVTMYTPQEHDLYTTRTMRDNFDCVSIQGDSARIKDEGALRQFISNPEGFWNAQSPYETWDGDTRPEMMLVLRHGSSTLNLDSNFTNTGPFGNKQCVSMWRDRQEDWQFEFSNAADTYHVKGIIRKDDSSGAVTLWCSTQVYGPLDETRLGPSILALNHDGWYLLSMKHGIQSSAALDQYITTNDWTDADDALLVYPRRGNFANWRIDPWGATLYQPERPSQGC
jgi:hypothetical protein